MIPPATNESDLDIEMNRNKCNDANEEIVSYMDDTNNFYGPQDNNTIFKKTEIEYTTYVHGNYMDEAMHIIYVD